MRYSITATVLGLALGPLLVCTPAASAQWSATIMAPPGTYESEIWSLSPGVQGGMVAPTSTMLARAALWHGVPGAWIDFGPGGTIYAMTPAQQVGIVNGLGAALWSGTPQSGVSLFPGLPGMNGSTAYALAGGQQVGKVSFSNATWHAALWYGTAGSFVDLNPPGAIQSIVNATDGTRQWGGANIQTASGVEGRPGYWTGTANSFVNLNPSPGWGGVILGVGGGQAAGLIRAPGVVQNHAATCDGTPMGWRDLHAFGAYGESEAYATNGAVQVGWSHVPNSAIGHAAAWFGTPESFVDLNQFLPPGYGGESIATCVIEDRGAILVGGFTTSPNGFSHAAVLWTYLPPCYANCDSSRVPPILNVSDFICFLNRYAAGDPYANCDGSTMPPVLNVSDFTCFLNQYALGCP